MRVTIIMTPVRHRKGIKASDVPDEPHEKHWKLDGKVLPGGKAWKKLSLITGGFVGISLGILTSVYVATLHENDLWFSNIKEVEREISFRTECGLYYSYYKQMLQAPSIQTGLRSLIYDNKTESMRTINVLERMNVYQEVFLSILYRTFHIKKFLEPIYFYIYTLFGLQAVYVVALYVTSWLLSGTWLSGVLAAFWYITNRVDTTRVEFTIPLRENWALPVFAVQVSAISFLFRPHLRPAHERLTLLAVFVSTFLFSLAWQFNQFMLLIQALVLFTLDSLDFLPRGKVTWIYIIQVASLLLVCFLQFFNTMIAGSLLISFNMSALLARKLQMHLKKRTWFSKAYASTKFVSLKGATGLFAILHQQTNTTTSLDYDYVFNNLKTGGLFSRLGKLFLHVLLVLCLTFLVNNFMKKILNLESDEHIFKFLKAKFGFGATRDFDANLYLCEEAFGLLPFDTFTRLSNTLVFYAYVFVLFVMATAAAVVAFQNLRGSANNKSMDRLQKCTMLLKPSAAYNLVHTILFGCLALSTMRMKYIWTSHLCVFAASGLCSSDMWGLMLKCVRLYTPQRVSVMRYLTPVLILLYLCYKFWPRMMAELSELREFYDPDTVELMNWIKSNTPKKAVIAGSMQLLAGVKLCTGRVLTNHPHYEDKSLRERTKQVYQVYAKRSPEEVYKILRSFGTDFVILEDSMCYGRRHGRGCRLRDLLDVANGHTMDGPGDNEPDLKPSQHPRFCEEIKRSLPPYTVYFTKVFQNKTFHVYKLAKHKQTT